ncbi:MAG: sugar phosphate isomerase/epimerase family protein [Tepidisphaeraceae bacterium]
MNVRFSVTLRSFPGDTRDALRAASAAGFTGVLLDSISPTLKPHELSQTGRRELLHLVSSSNLTLTGLQARLPGDGFAPKADVEQSLAHATRAMQACADLKAPLLCLDVGPLPSAPVEDLPKPAVTEAMLGLLVLPTKKDVERIAAPLTSVAKSDPAFEDSVNAALTELGQRADRFGVVVAIRSSLASHASIDRALKAVRCPWFGVDLDPVALLADEMPVDEVFARIGPLVRHVRGRDAVRGLGNRVQTTLLGEGKVDWTGLRALLDDAGYAGPITVDPSDLPNTAIAASLGRTTLERVWGR